MAGLSQSAVLRPVTIGGLRLRNRVVMAAMTRSRSDESGVPPPIARHYAQRADAGPIVTEATDIPPQARGHASTPGIWSDRQTDAWRSVVEAVQRRDGIIFPRLWHTGRLSHPDLQGGALPVAPSAVRPEGQAFTPRG